MRKFLIIKIREYIFIILTATIFLLVFFVKSFAEENVFIVDQVEVEGPIDLNFSREKYINSAFIESFNILTSRILLSRDSGKINNIEIKKIKNLINSFQILEETYKNENYRGVFKIFYNDIKVKKFLGQKNISFSQSKNISAIFFPVFFVNDEIIDFEDNYFYKHWNNIKIKNESINFILPIEDLEDVHEIKKMKNKIEDLDTSKFVNKYNIENYIFVLMDYKAGKLNTHIKTNLDQNKMTKNILYKIQNIEDKDELTLILKDLKLNISDIWKEANIVNLFMPLSITVKFQQEKLSNLDKLRDIFYKISIIDNYSLEKFDIKYSYFKIYYYGNPKKLRTELLKFGYQLINDQGHWEIKKKDE